MPHRAPSRALVRLVILVVAAALGAGACMGSLGSPTPVPGSSDVKSESRSVAMFSSVTVSGPLNVVLSTGAAEALIVEAPANVLSLVTTEVDGSELVVKVEAPGFTSANPATVRITSPSIDAVALEGGAHGTMEAMGQSLTVSASGGSVLKGIGAVQQLSLTVLGNSETELGDLTSQTAAIALAGGAKATIHVAKQLTGTADGGSVVTLASAPTAQSVTLTGGAKIVGP
jgi:hypothetical protein